MRTFHFVLWQDVLDPALADAVAVVAGAVTLEWMSHGPGAATEIAVSGPGLPDELGEADFGRCPKRKFQCVRVR